MDSIDALPIATAEFESRASAEAQISALSDPAVFELVVHHPAMDVSGMQVAGFRVADLLAHVWDLARAIGADEMLDLIGRRP